MHCAKLDAILVEKLVAKQPLLWCNPHLAAGDPGSNSIDPRVDEARARLDRCGPLLVQLFPELVTSKGVIESALMPARPFQQATLPGCEQPGHWFIKRDDQLPIAGSIKARGGFHEVLAFAEKVGAAHGLFAQGEDHTVLASERARALFSQYSVTVGSTGNLGLSIGVMAAALGFDAVVHMSADAKAWKKDRLRNRGVRVVEHEGDYAEAVEAGRALALQSDKCHFVDDERSPLLFFGYAAAAARLAEQLAEQGRPVDADNPLFVYLPCGVGGAPGGITYGLKGLFGEHVHCFFAEPVASPCVLVQLASGSDEPVSVYDIGLDNKTEADGLAVGLASEFVCPLMRKQLSGVFTVADDDLYLQLLALRDSMGVEVEPSAAAGFSGPDWIINSAEGKAYVKHHGINLNNVTHVMWATGGSLVPPIELNGFITKAERIKSQM